jgi:chaperone modulatory protein CbpM
MRDEQLLIGVVVDDAWLPLEQVAAVCRVEPEWLLRHINDDLLPGVTRMGDIWHFSHRSVRRAQRMRQLERDFDAAPELAALMSDLLDEMDEMRNRLRRAGLAAY